MSTLHRWLALSVALAAGPLGAAPDRQAADKEDLANMTAQFPAQHPYLALTPADSARAKERAAQFPWAKKALEKVADDARGAVAKPLGKLPEKGDTEHWSIANRLQSVALAYGLTGETQHAEWVRDGLLAYADVYPAMSLTNGRCKVFTQSSLYEAMWVEPIAQAYDLVADSGVLTDEQKAHIEADLLRPTVACFKIDDFENDPRIRDLHYRCYNFQAWHLGAVGLVGLALRDPELVDYAVNSPYGFRHLVAHDIREDGLFWERSVGYHHFVLNALLPFTEAMLHCGVDLYHFTVPNDRAKDEDCHCVTDVTDQPKSLRLMFEAPFYLGFPDLSYLALGDSDRGPLHATWMDLIGYDRYRDPKLAWLLQRDVPLSAEETRSGRVGFLHYYRYRYRYDQVRLNGQPVKWERRDPTFEPQGDAITVEDGGASQSDHYLLNGADRADLTLEWTMTRLADSGGQDRAWVVFHVDAKDTANRKCFGLPSLCPELNHPYRFRLEVKGGSAQLARDGESVATKPTVYSRTPDWQWLIHDSPAEAAQRARLDLPPAFANTGRYENGCSLFPASGVAVLRQAAGDFTTQPESTAVAFSYGPYGGGHGHPDKLSIAVYAQGRQWIPQVGSMPYETNWKAEWTAQTISNNTVVVDGVSQKPTGERNTQWPADSATDKVLGKLDRFDAEHKLVSASCDSAYDGLLLHRTAELHGALVVDQYAITPQDAAGGKTHQFDYVLHIDGQFVESTAALSPRSGPLGDKCGYQHVEQKQGATIEGVTSLTFASGDKRLRLWIVPANATPLELILADGLSNSPTARMPMVVLRQGGASARYLTLFEPLDEKAPLRAVRLERGIAGGPAELVLERETESERVRLN